MLRYCLYVFSYTIFIYFHITIFKGLFRNPNNILLTFQAAPLFPSGYKLFNLLSAQGSSSSPSAHRAPTQSSTLRPFRELTSRGPSHSAPQHSPPQAAPKSPQPSECAPVWLPLLVHFLRSPSSPRLLIGEATLAIASVLSPPPHCSALHTSQRQAGRDRTFSAGAKVWTQA